MYNIDQLNDKLLSELKEIAETLSLNETSIGQYVARGRKEFVGFYGKTRKEA